MTSVATSRSLPSSLSTASGLGFAMRHEHCHRTCEKNHSEIREPEDPSRGGLRPSDLCHAEARVLAAVQQQNRNDARLRHPEDGRVHERRGQYRECEIAEWNARLRGAGNPEERQVLFSERRKDENLQEHEQNEAKGESRGSAQRDAGNRRTDERRDDEERPSAERNGNSAPGEAAQSEANGRAWTTLSLGNCGPCGPNLPALARQPEGSQIEAQGQAPFWWAGEPTLCTLGKEF